MNTTSADTNIFLYAANPASPWQESAQRFLSGEAVRTSSFVVCELVLVELYMQLRNPAVLKNPLDSGGAAAFCERLRSNPVWQHVDYEPPVSIALWQWARSTQAGFRHIIDARLALTLRHHGVQSFATAQPAQWLRMAAPERHRRARQPESKPSCHPVARKPPEPSSKGRQARRI